MTPDRPAPRPWSLFGGSAVLLFGNGFYLLFTFLTNIFLARSLQPADYGLLMALIGIVGILNFVSSAGPAQLVSLEIAQRPEAERGLVAKAALLAQLVLLAGLSAVAITLGPFLRLLYGSDGFYPLWFLALLTIPPYGLFYLLLGIHAGLGRYAARAVAYALAALSRLAATMVLVAILARRVFAGMLGYIVASVVGTASALIPIRNQVSGGGQAASRPSWRSFLFRSRGLLALTLAVFVAGTLDVSVAAVVLGEHEAGTLAAISQVAKLPYFAAGAMQVVSLQWGNGIGRTLGSPTSLRRILAVHLLASAPILAVSFIAPGPLMASLGGPAYGSVGFALPLATLAYVFLGLALLLLSAIAGAGSGRAANFLAVGMLCLLAVGWSLLGPSGVLGFAQAAAVSAGLGAAGAAVWLIARLRTALFLPLLDFIMATSLPIGVGFVLRGTTGWFWATVVTGAVSGLIALAGLWRYSRQREIAT